MGKIIYRITTTRRTDDYKDRGDWTTEEEFDKYSKYMDELYRLARERADDYGKKCGLFRYISHKYTEELTKYVWYDLYCIHSFLTFLNKFKDLNKIKEKTINKKIDELKNMAENNKIPVIPDKDTGEFDDIEMDLIDYLESDEVCAGEFIPKNFEVDVETIDLEKKYNIKII